jgi:hypothetical protein
MGTFRFYTSCGQNLMGETTGYTYKVTTEEKNSLEYILYLLQNCPLPVHLPNSPSKVHLTCCIYFHLTSTNDPTCKCHCMKYMTRKVTITFFPIPSQFTSPSLHLNNNYYKSVGRKPHTSRSSRKLATSDEYQNSDICHFFVHLIMILHGFRDYIISNKR